MQGGKNEHSTMTEKIQKCALRVACVVKNDKFQRYSSISNSRKIEREPAVHTDSCLS